VYLPSPGFVDLESDAQDAPPLGELRDLDIPGVGVVAARRPRPRTCPIIAGQANNKLDRVDRAERVNQLVAEHTADGEMDRLMIDMMNGDLPADTIARTARAITCWGTARPYAAVITLCGVTGHHWRTLRGKLIAAGISDPMRLPSLHALLDYTESTVLESMQGGGDSRKAQRDRTEYFDRMYKPDVVERVTDGRLPIPAGFEPDEVEDAFDAFTRIAR
jgi:hypothetical protein